MSLFGIKFDPSNQSAGIAKWVATAAAGYLAGKFKLGADGTATVSALFLGIYTLVAQIVHRAKVGRALTATARLSSTIDPELISSAASNA